MTSLKAETSRTWTGVCLKGGLCLFFGDPRVEKERFWRVSFARKGDGRFLFARQIGCQGRGS